MSMMTAGDASVKSCGCDATQSKKGCQASEAAFRSIPWNTMPMRMGSNRAGAQRQCPRIDPTERLRDRDLIADVVGILEQPQ
jgi:hypothetical protein